MLSRRANWNYRYLQVAGQQGDKYHLQKILIKVKYFGTNMDLMQQWIRNSEDTNQVAFVPNYTSYDFVPRVQTIGLKDLVVLAYGLPHSHLLRVPWIIGNCCESEMHFVSCFLRGSLRISFSLFTFLSTAFFIVFLRWYSPFLLSFV